MSDVSIPRLSVAMAAPTSSPSPQRHLHFRLTVDVVYDGGFVEEAFLAEPDDTLTPSDDPFALTAAVHGPADRGSTKVRAPAEEHSAEKDNEGEKQGSDGWGEDCLGDEDFDEFDFDEESLALTWPERRENTLGCRCGTPKAVAKIGSVFRSEQIRMPGTGSVAFGPTHIPGPFKPHPFPPRAVA